MHSRDDGLLGCIGLANAKVLSRAKLKLLHVNAKALLWSA